MAHAQREINHTCKPVSIESTSMNNSDSKKDGELPTTITKSTFLATGATFINKEQAKESGPSSETQQAANLAVVCKLGQESIQDIVGLTKQYFANISTLNFPTNPNGVDNEYEEKRKTLQNIFFFA